MGVLNAAVITSDTAAVHDYSIALNLALSAPLGGPFSHTGQLEVYFEDRNGDGAASVTVKDDFSGARVNGNTPPLLPTNGVETLAFPFGVYSCAGSF